MNEIYIVNGQLFEVSPEKKQDFLNKYPNAVLQKDLQVKTAGVSTGALAPMGQAPDMVSKSASGSSVSQDDKIKISPLQSIKNAFANVGRDVERIGEFYTGESSTMDLASAAIFEKAFGRETTKNLINKYGKDSWLTQGIGMDEILENIPDVEKEMAKKPTIGIVEAFTEGDISDKASSILSTVINAVGSVGYGAGTLGTGFFFDYAAENYIDYNEQKAKRVGKSLEQLIQDGEAETTAPVAIGFGQQALENFGLGQIIKSLGKGVTKGVGGKIIDLLQVGSAESSTEVGQHLLTKYNQRLSEDGDATNAMKKVFEQDLFTEETLENGLQGFVGGAGVRGGSIAVQEGVTKKVKIDPKVTMAVRTSEESQQIEKAFKDLVQATDLYRTTKNEDLKAAAEETIMNAKDDITDAVIQGNIRAEKIGDIEQRRIKGLSEITKRQFSVFQQAKQEFDQGLITNEQFDLIRNKSIDTYKKHKKYIDEVLAVGRKIETQAKEISKYYDIEVVPTAQEFKKKIPVADILADGAIIDKQKKIYINRERAERLGVITSSSHELLHGILRNTTAFKIDKDGNYVNKKEALKIVNELESIIDKYDTKGVVRKRLVDNYNIERDKDGKIVGGQIEEYLTSFNDALIDGDVEVQQTLMQQIKDWVLKILRKVGFVNADFKSTDDIYNFIIDYSKTIAEQDKVSQRAQDILKRQPGESDAVFESRTQDAKNKAIDDLVGEKDEDGNYITTDEEYKNPNIQGRIYDELLSEDGPGIYLNIISAKYDKMRGGQEFIFGKDRKTFIENLSDMMIDPLLNFKPQSNNSLIGWLNFNMNKLALTLYNRYKKEQTKSLDIESGEIGAVQQISIEDEIDASKAQELEAQRVSELIRPADLLSEAIMSDEAQGRSFDSDVLQAMIESDFDNKVIDASDLTFKKLPSLINEQMTSFFGINDVNKLKNIGQNLSTAEFRNIQRFIIKNQEQLKALLPKGAVVEAATEDLIGTSTGVYKNLLKAFYEKSPKRRTDAPGLWEFELKENITDAEFLKAFGLNEKGNPIPDPQGRSGGRTPESQTSKGLVFLLGRMITNTEVRKIMERKGYSKLQIQDLAAGKSDAMFSRRQDVENKVERRREMNVFDMENRMASILSQQDKRYTPAQQIDDATAKKLAKDRKTKRFSIIPANADDFAGLIYRFLGKGQRGEEQLAFFQEYLFKPFGRAYTQLNAARTIIGKRFKDLNKKHKATVKKLKEDSGVYGFTNEDALKVYLYVNKAGVQELPGLSQENQQRLIAKVIKDKDIRNYAADLLNAVAPGLDTSWVEPDGQSWLIDTIGSDVNRIVEQVSRAQFLSEWVANKDAIFSENNMNKIRATYGDKFVGALKDMLYRMETGSTRRNDSGGLGGLLDWFRGSVGVTMFLNTRSMTLQQLSNLNFINWGDNNPIAAAKALANQPQYWEDFMKILKSDFLTQRRGGLRTDVLDQDIADIIAAGTKKGASMYQTYRYFIAKLLQRGFILTQIGDSVAIATGGATFYRNRVNTYLKQGLDNAEAEKKAFVDFQEIAEETQQSARPDRLSKVQTTNIGRVLLAFQNTPMQYARLTVKAAQDLANRRGDYKTNLSKLMYYGFAQGVMFSMAQNLLNPFSLFGEDDEDKEKQQRVDAKANTVVNNVMDSFVRGLGVQGTYVVGAKNTLASIIDEINKLENPGTGRYEPGNVIVDFFNTSPAIGIKARKLFRSMQDYKYDQKVIKEMGLDIENPAFDIAGQMSAFAFNVPLDRAVYLARNGKDALDPTLEAWQRLAAAFGWTRWTLGTDDRAVEEVKKEIRKRNAAIRRRKSSSGKSKGIYRAKIN